MREPADDVLDEAEEEQEDVEVGLAGEEAEEDSDDDDLAGNADVLVLEEERPQQLNGEYADLVNKVRKDWKKFRRGLADEKLQEYVKKEHVKELKLKLDVRVRWNSIEEMFTRYVQLRSCMMKAFVDLKQMSNVPDEKLEMVKQMAIVLKPVKLANEALRRRDATRISAEGILKFMFTQLDKQDSEFSRNICNRIRERIGQRRDKDVVSLLQYLHNPDTLQTVPTDAFFAFASKNTIMRLAKAELRTRRRNTRPPKRWPWQWHQRSAAGHWDGRSVPRETASAMHRSERSGKSCTKPTVRDTGLEVWIQDVWNHPHAHSESWIHIPRAANSAL